MKTEILETVQYLESKDDKWELRRQLDFYYVVHGCTTKIATAWKWKEGIDCIINYFTNPHPIMESCEKYETFEIKKHIWLKEMEFVSLCKKYRDETVIETTVSNI